MSAVNLPQRAQRLHALLLEHPAGCTLTNEELAAELDCSTRLVQMAMSELFDAAAIAVTLERAGLVKSGRRVVALGGVQ